VEIVQTLLRKHKVNSHEVAILTPYSAQKVVIQRELKTAKLDGGIRVATISESQGITNEQTSCLLAISIITIVMLSVTGDEYGFVILSVVRSKPLQYVQHPEYISPDQYWIVENLGFVTNRHQINVGITRSKYGQIIIGKVSFGLNPM